jgi:carbon-monoxide dehydrogenase small subunit
MIELALTVNGRPVTLTSAPFRRLLDVLREDLGLTGSKEGCGEGECGACSVILNGELVNSCIIPAIQAQGASITTVESVQEVPLGSAIQRAFCEHGGAQCGICTPGMIMTAYWLSMNRDRLPPGAALRDLMAGNLCRCTGYDLILESVEAALAGDGSPSTAVDATRAAEGGA